MAVRFARVAFCALTSFSLGIASTAFAMVGGVALKKGNPGVANAVGLVMQNAKGQQSICTGSLIANNTVLTASHCLKGQAKVFVVFGDDFNDEKHLEARAAERAVMHPLYGRYPSPNFDIAFVQFKGPLPKGYAPLAILDTPALIPNNTPHVMVGYGNTSGDAHDSGVKRTIQNDNVGYIPIAIKDDRIFKSVVMFNQSKTRGVCQGDSGGPTYVHTQAGWEIAGVMVVYVTSAEDHHCDNKGVAFITFPGDYISWLRAAKAIK